MDELTPISDGWLDAPAVAVCDRCGRNSWAPDAVDTVDQMTQPDGLACGGWFVANR
jgi:hypothetical protein